MLLFVLVVTGGNNDGGGGDGGEGDGGVGGRPS